MAEDFARDAAAVEVLGHDVSVDIHPDVTVVSPLRRCGQGLKRSWWNDWDVGQPPIGGLISAETIIQTRDTSLARAIQLATRRA